MPGHADNIAERLVKTDWEHERGKDRDSDQFFGVVKIGDVEVKRFSLTRASYENDDCAPCQSTVRKLRNEVAKQIREVYGE